MARLFGTTSYRDAQTFEDDIVMSGSSKRLYHSTAPLNLGAAGTPNRVSTADDVFIGAKLEVDGVVDFDSTIICRSNNQVIGRLRFGSPVQSDIVYSAVTSPGALVWSATLASENIIISRSGATLEAWNHQASTDPTVFLQSGVAGNHSEYLRLRWNEVATGTGDLTLAPANGLVQVTGGVTTTATITGVTESPGTNSTALASTAFVGGAVGDNLDVVLSRGMNLITNGTAFLKNNTGFSELTYTGVEVPPGGGSGSFFTSTLSLTVFGDTKLPVDAAKHYELRGWIRGDTSVSKVHYFGGAFYDIDDLSILAYHHMFQPNTTTALAVALKPGDTTITLTSAATWYLGPTAHLRSIILWNYKNSLGFEYPVNTYSRFYSNSGLTLLYLTTGLYAETTGISGNVITLEAPWPTALGNPDDGGGEWPIGTDVSNGSSGGSFKYFVASAQPLNAAWTEYRGLIGDLDLSGTNVNDEFPPGTSYMKLLFLTNRSGTSGGTSTQYIANLWFSEITPNNLIDTSNDVLFERGGDFGLLKLGGDTVSYPALKRNGADLEARLADDSARTTILASTFQALGSGSFSWDSRSAITSPADGNVLLTDNAGADFDLLQFGGTTALFPALRRNATALECRLADDSNYATFIASTGLFTGPVRVGAAQHLEWGSTNSKIKSPADGELTLLNQAENDFTMLRFGGTTASFPALKRSTTSIHIRLADDSNYASLSAANLLSFGATGCLIADAASFVWLTRSRIKSLANGNITLYNQASSDFGLLQFGGTTSAFPAFKRVGTQIYTRLADDSGDATFRAGNFVAINSVQAGAGGEFRWGASRSKLLSPIDSKITLLNDAGTDFDLLQLGGTTASFPALKRSSASLQARLADDSGFATMSVQDIFVNGSLQASSGGHLIWNVRSRLRSPSDGAVQLTNWASTDFSLLHFGLLTSSFPALKRNGADFDVRVGDDTAYASLNAKDLTTNEANGQQLAIQTATTELVGLSGATATAASLIPGGSIVLGLTARVTTTITGATTFDIGDGTNVDAFGAAIALPSGTTSDTTDWTIATAPVYTAATSVVLTANGSSFTAGAVRVTVHYVSTTAPTS